MPDQQPPAPRAQDLIARAQELVDTKPAEGSHPLEWAVPAYYLGDMSALAIVSLRSHS
jgi:hypothetical protein